MAQVYLCLCNGFVLLHRDSSSKDSPVFPKRLADALADLDFTQLVDKHFQPLSKDAKDFGVIHGDFWLPNILLSSTHPSQAAMIDFQFVAPDLPLMDLLAFLYSSLTTEVRRTNERALIERYFARRGVDFASAYTEDHIHRSRVHTLLVLIAGACDIWWSDKQNDEQKRRWVAAVEDMVFANTASGVFTTCARE